MQMTTACAAARKERRKPFPGSTGSNATSPQPVFELVRRCRLQNQLPLFSSIRRFIKASFATIFPELPIAATYATSGFAGCTAIRAMARLSFNRRFARCRRHRWNDKRHRPIPEEFRSLASPVPTQTTPNPTAQSRPRRSKATACLSKIGLKRDAVIAGLENAAGARARHKRPRDCAHRSRCRRRGRPSRRDRSSAP